MAKKKAKTWVAVEIKYDGKYCARRCPGHGIFGSCEYFKAAPAEVRVGTRWHKLRLQRCIDNECEVIE